jgi:hypothetical protein
MRTWQLVLKQNGSFLTCSISFLHCLQYILYGMNRLLIFIFCCCMQYGVGAQVSDYISVRKPNGRTVKNFMAGLPIIFETKTGTRLDGWIKEVRNDSIVMREYIVRKVMTNWGVFVLDTAGSLLHAVHFKDIGRIRIKQKQNFILRRTDDLLLAGGAGYLLLNLLNCGYLNESSSKSNNLRKLSMATGAIGLGMLWHRLFGDKEYTTRRHRILYINMQLPAKPM